MKTITKTETKTINIYEYNELSIDVQNKIKKNMLDNIIHNGMIDELIDMILLSNVQEKEYNITTHYQCLYKYSYYGDALEMFINDNKKLSLLIRFVLPNADINGENVKYQIFDVNGFKLENYLLLSDSECLQLANEWRKLQQSFYDFDKDIELIIEHYHNNHNDLLDTKELINYCSQYYFTIDGEDIGLITEING
jgi:hypothetical protein|nr:MAG TPA: hypothetical protein [Caudoviricetes sp.]